MVVDMSGSIASDFEEMKRFAKDVVEHFAPLGEEGAKFGLIKFSDYATLLSTFSANQTAVNGAIDALQWWGETHIARGLELAREQFESAAHRSDATKIVLLLSDGEQSGRYGGRPAAIDAATQVKAAGIRCSAKRAPNR